METNLYSRVAERCSRFYPQMNMFKSCPEASVPSCTNCRNYKAKQCTLNLFDSIASNLK